MPLTLSTLFEAMRNQLPDELRDLVETAEDLNRPVSAGEYKVLEAGDDKLEVDKDTVEIFDQDFEVSGKLAADLKIQAAETFEPEPLKQAS